MLYEIMFMKYLNYLLSIFVAKSSLYDAWFRCLYVYK